MMTNTIASLSIEKIARLIVRSTPKIGICKMYTTKEFLPKYSKNLFDPICVHIEMKAIEPVTPNKSMGIIFQYVITASLTRTGRFSNKSKNTKYRIKKTRIEIFWV